MKIYLAGSVPKGDNEAADFKNWREHYRMVLLEKIDAVFIDPYDRGSDFPEKDFLAVFGFDCKDLKTADLIIVNAESQLGVGTSQELVIAKYFKKPVITVLPKDSHHRRSNIVFREELIKDWVHPFLFSFSDLIVSDIGKISKITIQKLISKKPKNIKVIDQAIQHIEKYNKEIRQQQK